jgi:Holliday junction resolvase
MPKGPEAKLWQQLKKGLKNSHLVRIESRVDPGVPDVNGCTNGQTYWLELKVSKGNHIRLSKYQKAWIYERSKFGGKVFVCARALPLSPLKVYDSSIVRGHGTPFPVLTLQHPYDWSKLEQLLGSSQVPSENPVSR